ncbi:hypothetical protein A1O1_07766 [Capronia coronata CBS 617.96]|uniref:DNA repair protein Rad26 n=1 Tax=Capronia coronata CBS 617.96 TaxID=1182541 RepID=W9XXJ1_9EURO|nr:uncharacterized protein A1O1_07766 [Capronia coronata CBS 617.96]EXJ81701.1 hypothetical protein A1O1_07766 [Capronia coronata CBS 617.96]
MNGMEDDEDETDLFDDDFDNLSESALQELEQKAFLSTQQAYLQAQAAAKVQDNHTSLPHSRFQAQVPLNARPQPIHPFIQRHLTEPQSEDESFELVGEEGVSTPVDEYEAYPLRRLQPGEAIQREQFRQQRHGQTYNGAPHRTINPRNGQSQHGSNPPAPFERRSQALHIRPDEMLLDDRSQEGPHAPPQIQGSEILLLRLEELMRERDELNRQLQATKDIVLMQKGEISIIRANFEKEIKVYDRKISALEKTMAEESAKHTAALHTMMEKNETLSTSYNFLQQEHNQELENIKTLQQRLRDKQQSTKENNSATTPKRGMVSSLRDGFDDDDVMAISPSKSGRRSKPGTPPAANKRKRKADAPSPVKPLVLRATSTIPVEMAPPAAPVPIQPEDEPVTIVRTDKQAERNLQFLQDILEYRVRGSTETVVEGLVRFSFPSAPSKTFSTTFIEATARLRGNRLPRDVLQILTDLWSKSLKEQYYKPVASLIQIINHVIDLDMSVLDTETVAPLALVLQNSAAINANTRFKHSPVNHATFGKVRQTPQSLLNHDVSGTDCLELLLTVAYAVSDEPELLSLFWRVIDPEFVLMLLNVWQPIADITIMLRLLATSTFPSTFSSICVDDQQDQIEDYVLNRICYLLWETPKVDEGLPPNTMEELCQLRVEVMDLLIRIAITSSPHPHDDRSHHGSRLIAGHQSAIGRIVRSLYDEVSAMYELTPSHALHAEIVNKGVHLLYHVLQLHGQDINLQEKLSVVNGGVHKHRVVLTRLAFSEGFYVDRLIRDETVAMATSMLEESVTPDEADELIEAFPGFKGRGAVLATE